MMFNTFSTFDFLLVETSPMWPTLMFSVITSVAFLQTFWLYKPTRATPILQTSSITHSLCSSTNSKLMVGTTAILTPVFILLILQNLAGIIPWGPALTSHLFFTLSLAMPVWASMVLASSALNHKTSTSHFILENTSSAIAPFLALVEIISTVIRPITLSFRLSANMSAGHVILGMMGASASFITISTVIKLLPLILSTGTLYVMFESMICLAQSFVLTLLCSMYTNDHINPKP